MTTRLSLTQIVRDVTEPRRTRLLKDLHRSGEAVTIVYRPHAEAPPWRRDGYTVQYGIPARQVRFEPGRPKAVSIGLAVLILHQYRKRATDVHDLRWWDDEWQEVSPDFQVTEPIEVARTQESEEVAAHTPVSRDTSGASFGQSEPTLPAGETDGYDEDVVIGGDSSPRRYLSQMTRSELASIHETELGPVPEGATRDEIYAKVRTHRESGSA